MGPEVPVVLNRSLGRVRPENRMSLWNWMVPKACTKPRSSLVRRMRLKR
jgi:hypothetical protein